MTIGKVMKNQPIKILICGKEQITVVSEAVKKFQQIVGSAKVTQDIAVLFKNSYNQNCPITKYQVVSSSGSLLVGVDAALVSMKDSSLTIQYTEVKKISF